MKKKSSYRWLIWIILAVVLIGVALMHILPPYIDRWKSARDYDKLAEEYVNDESEPDDGKQKKKDWWATDVKVEFDKLKAENPDVIGWIRFDNQDELGINYPILYSGDNEKYLRTDLYGNSHIAGCIFLEGLNKSDFSDYYNIIYGHNMNDGSMFGSLKKYKDDGFWKKINTSLYILRQPPTVIESSLMKMRSMAVMCIKWIPAWRRVSEIYRSDDKRFRCRYRSKAADQ